MTRPGDEHDQRMTALVRPPGWAVAPAPQGYDLVAIGGGTGGLVTASGAGLLGARTALIERDLLGGDCLVHGCVPSKALLHAARVVHEVRRAGEWGVQATLGRVDFAAVMRRLRSIRADIARDDSAETLAARDVDVLFGTARFTGPRTLELDGAPIRFKRAVIATGARPRVPPVPGLAELAITNEQVFDLEELPRRLLVVGGGPIGSEMAQAFARLGSAVTVVELGERLLGVDDPDAGALLAEVLREEGVDVRLQTSITALARGADGLEATVEGPDGVGTVVADTVLVAVGRQANTEGLGLDEAGVRVGRGGIVVDRHQRTSNRRIYAVGDVAVGPNFTHAAYAQGATAMFSALLPVSPPRRTSPMSWVTYTDPEVAHVGLRVSDLQRLGDRVQTTTLPMHDNDRARTDGHARGFARVHVRRGTDRILAATLVGRGAGEGIGEIALAMTVGQGLRAIADTIHPYPTRSWLTAALAREHNLARITPSIRAWLRRWFAWGLR